MKPEYQFLVSTTYGGEQRVMHPIWKDDLALEYAFEGSNYFRRASLSGSLTFIGNEFDYINNESINTTFYIEIWVDYNHSHIWHNVFSGMFNKTDATFNADDKTVVVKPRVNDRYNKILAGLDKEYDLIKLTPAMQPVDVTRRPMTQIYIHDNDVVNCCLSGMNWEQDIDSDDLTHLIHDCHFGRLDQLAEVNIHSAPSGMTNVFVKTTIANGMLLLENGEGEYYIRTSVYSYEGDEIDVQVLAVNSPSTVLWSYTGEPGDNITLTSQRTGVADLTADVRIFWVYARLCLAKNTFRTEEVFEIPTDDVVTYNRNYKYCVPIEYGDVSTLIVMSYNGSTTPTKWGIRPDGKYYSEPTGIPNVIRYMPVAQSLWGNASIWYCQTSVMDQYDVDGRKLTTIRDAYSLDSVINALLSQIDSSITFAASATYSQFLYGTNPFMENWGRLVITPKSNILVAEYTQPARKAPITLGKVLNMLRDVCGCYWYIDDYNRLRIEQIAFFKNGGSYSTPPVVGIDLTTVKNMRNGKSWGFCTNEWSFDKIDMPQRYEYEWMDDTTETFKGDAIEVLSPYVQEGKIEEVNIDGFNADVDYMMLNPSNVSEDGFALLCCDIVWRTQIAEVGTNNYVQNWQLAMPVLQPNFLISDMPAWNIKVNGTERIAQNIQRKRKQKVDYPCGESFEPDAMKMVKTGLGNGEIEKLSLKLTSRMATINVRYTTG